MTIYQIKQQPHFQGGKNKGHTVTQRKNTLIIENFSTSQKYKRQRT